MIRFGYFGQFFHGLQPQKDVPTAGAALLAHLTQAAGVRPKALCFAARTDKGVHAIENIATCWFKDPFNKKEFLENFSNLKAEGLRNIEAVEVSKHVHARGSSRGKRYQYIINGSDAHTSWQIQPRIDISRMAKALELIKGEHDFKSFQASGCTAATTVKNIISATVCHSGLDSESSNRSGEWETPHQVRADDRQAVIIDIFGTAFLRQMIRILVGLLAEIGTGLREPEDILKILKQRDRRACGITAPAQGLTLRKVEMEVL